MSNLENLIQQDLHQYLLSQNEVDQRLPEAPDIDEKWDSISSSYLPDGVREFKQYPTVSLGWMMYIGMAVAKFWDDDWSLYSQIDDLYLYMRDKSGFELMDEYIRSAVLKLGMPQFDTTEQLVQACAQRTYSLLMRQHIEPGTHQAFYGYVDCLRQLYQMGAAVQLHRMNYHMVKI